MSVENMFNLQMNQVGGLIEISQSSLAGRIPDNDTLLGLEEMYIVLITFTFFICV